MAFLRENILAEGDFYAGDLLTNVLNSDKEFWKRNGAIKQEVLNLYDMHKNLITGNKSIEKAYRNFMAE